MEPIDVLKGRVQKSSQSQVARDLDVSKQLISALLLRQRKISKRMARKLGLETVMTYRRKRKARTA